MDEQLSVLNIDFTRSVALGLSPPRYRFARSVFVLKVILFSVFQPAVKKSVNKPAAVITNAFTAAAPSVPAAADDWESPADDWGDGWSTSTTGSKSIILLSLSYIILLYCSVLYYYITVYCIIIYYIIIYYIILCNNITYNGSTTGNKYPWYIVLGGLGGSMISIWK